MRVEQLLEGAIRKEVTCSTMKAEVELPGEFLSL